MKILVLLLSSFLVVSALEGNGKPTLTYSVPVLFKMLIVIHVHLLFNIKKKNIELVCLISDDVVSHRALEDDVKIESKEGEDVATRQGSQHIRQAYVTTPVRSPTYAASAAYTEACNKPSLCNTTL